MTAVYPANRASPVKMGVMDPDALLDYSVLWDEWLSDDEIIEDVAVTATEDMIEVLSSTLNEDAVVVDGVTHKAFSVVTIWLSSGVLDEEPIITCRITTNHGRVDDRSFSLKIAER